MAEHASSMGSKIEKDMTLQHRLSPELISLLSLKKGPSEQTQGLDNDPLTNPTPLDMSQIFALLPLLTQRQTPGNPQA